MSWTRTIEAETNPTTATTRYVVVAVNGLHIRNAAVRLFGNVPALIGVARGRAVLGREEFHLVRDYVEGRALNAVAVLVLLNQFAYDVAESIANKQLESVAARVRESIDYMADGVDLIDRSCLDMGILTSKSIQEQYSVTIAKFKRKTQIKV